jgi:hypothetical protein
MNATMSHSSRLMAAQYLQKKHEHLLLVHELLRFISPACFLCFGNLLVERMEAVYRTAGQI